LLEFFGSTILAHSLGLFNAPSSKGDENEKTLQDDTKILARNSANKGLKRPCPKEAPSLGAKV
jgi:hypothetical protein